MYLPILFKVIMAPQVIKVKRLGSTPLANYSYKHIWIRASTQVVRRLYLYGVV